MFGTVQRFAFRGGPLETDRIFTLAFNSYDGQSAGRQLIRLRGIIKRPESRRITTSIDTRAALIDGFLVRGDIR